MSTHTTYTGRLGAICDAVLEDFNDTKMQFVGAQTALLALVNRCKDDLVQARYYHARATVDVTAAQADINLLTEFPTYDELIGVYWATTGEELTRICLPPEIETTKKFSTTTRPWAYYMDADTLTLIPTPNTTTTDGLVVHYYYRPADLTGLTAAAAQGSPGDPGYVPAVPDGTTPTRVPAGRDDVFIFYCLWKLYQRDRHAVLAPQFAKDHMALYERAKGRLIDHEAGDDRYLEPYR